MKVKQKKTIDINCSDINQTLECVSGSGIEWHNGSEYN